MNIPIKNIGNIPTPPQGYGYLFIDYDTKELKCKKNSGEIIKFNAGDNIGDITLLDLCDYSAFEIYAHDTPINVGPLSGTAHENFIGKSDDNIVFKVEPSMTESFTIRSEQGINDQNVIVDWGDGTAVKLCELEEPAFNGEYRYVLTHTYDKVGTYIIKIFGTSYFSFMGSNDPNTTLISRIFDYDLPIASHIWNLSSCCIHAQRLLRFNMYSHSASKNIKHFSKAFTSCRNLIEAFGFSKYNGDRYNYAIFNNCGGLKSTDLSLSVTPLTINGNASVFEKCYNLTTDINDLLPIQGFKSGSTIDLNKTFRACYLLSGTVPADKLWNDKTINWINISSTFELANEEIRSQVPISWGGTNELIENSLNFKKFVENNHIDLNDYSAFDVWPTSEDIPAGTIIENVVNAWDNSPSYLNGQTVEVAIPYHESNQRTNQDTEIFKIRSYHAPENIDVIVDWGDGTYTELSSLKPSNNNPDAAVDGFPEELVEYTYELIHTYTETNKVYRIKIYGKNYFTFEHLYATFEGCLCGCLGKDLPIASHINNLSGLGGRCRKLFFVEVSEYIQNAQICSLNNIFLYCQNLKYAIGFAKICNVLYGAQQAFSRCESLKFTDFRIPSYSFGKPTSNMFKACFAYDTKLAMDVLDLLPANGYLGKEATFGGLFNTCSALTCSDYDKLANMLWNNPDITWLDSTFAAAFRGCSAEFRANIPVSWGGTDSITPVKVNYTKFEIYPTTTAIPAKTNSTILGGTTTVEIPAQKTFKFNIRSSVTDFSKSDIIIDWGDKTKSKISDGINLELINTDLATNTGETKVIDGSIVSSGYVAGLENIIDQSKSGQTDIYYFVSHTYADKDCNKKIIVTINGNDYYAINTDTNNNGPSYYTTAVSPAPNIEQRCRFNLISNLMDITKDLPVHSNIRNYSSICKGSKRLLNLNINLWMDENDTYNFASAFHGNKNLLTANGIKKYKNNFYAVNDILSQNTALETTDFKFPDTPVKCSAALASCKKLAVNIRDILPDNMPQTGYNFTSVFSGCSLLSGSVPSFIWNDDFNIDVTNKNNPDKWAGSVTFNKIKYSNLNNSGMFYQATGLSNYKDIPKWLGGICENTKVLIHEFEITDDSTTLVEFSKEDLGIDIEYEFDILDKDGYNITTSSTISRRWYDSKYQISNVNGFKQGSYKLKTIKY